MAEKNKSTGSFERHAFTVTLLTIVSRMGGLLREASFSRFIGVSEASSALAFAMLVPNLFRRLFGEGALTAAIVPELARLEDRNPAEARSLAYVALTRVTLFLVFITLISEIILYAIPSSITEHSLGLRTLAIALPYMPLVCLAALAGAVLQVRGRFGPAASMPIVLNLSMVCSVVIAYVVAGGQVGSDHIWIVAIGLVAAGIAQALWTVVMVVRTRPAVSTASASVERRRPPGRRAHRAFRRVLLRSLPMILGLGVLQLNTFLDGLIAGWPAITGQSTIFGHDYPLGPKALATLTYAQRLYEFPLGVFGIAVATAIFPQLSREVARPDVFRSTLRKGLRLAFYIGLPASVGIAVLREPIVSVVYQGMAFNAEDVLMVSPVLLAYSVAIWSYSLNQVFVRGFYAQRRPMTAVWIAIAVVFLNLGLNIFFVFGTSLGVSGLAWSTAICAIIQTCALCFTIRRSLGAIMSREVLGSMIRTLLSALIMGGILVLLFGVMPSTTTWIGHLLQLLLLVPVGALCFAGATFMLGMPEWRWALGRAADAD